MQKRSDPIILKNPPKIDFPEPPKKIKKEPPVLNDLAKQLSQTSQNFNLTHKSYMCPIYHDKGTKSKIYCSNFKKLFDENNKLTIPIFQRLYCWRHAQHKKWFEDLCEISFKNHRIGTIHLCKLDGNTLVLDGQQRIVTLISFMCALRHFFQKMLKTSQNEEQETISEDSQNLAQKQCCNLIIQKLSKNNIEAQIQIIQDFLFVNGEKRVKPCMPDRNQFNSMTEGTGYNMEDGFIKNAYDHFTKKLDNLLNNLEWNTIEKLLQSATERMDIVISEVYDIKCGQQLFLWLQEPKSGWFMKNDAPGIVFRASEFSKNLFLSQFLSSNELAEKVYVQYWMPIEKRFSSLEDQVNKVFDEYLIHFLVHNKVPAHIKIAMKQKEYNEGLLKNIDSVIIQKLISLDIYYMFQEFYEEEKIRWMNKNLKENSDYDLELNNFSMNMMMRLQEYIPIYDQLLQETKDKKQD